MNKDKALKMAMRFAKSNILTRISGLHGENPLTGQEVFDACKEALEQPSMTYEQGFAHGYEAYRAEQALRIKNDYQS